MQWSCGPQTGHRATRGIEVSLGLLMLVEKREAAAHTYLPTRTRAPLLYAVMLLEPASVAHSGAGASLEQEPELGDLQRVTSGGISPLLQPRNR